MHSGRLAPLEDAMHDRRTASQALAWSRSVARREFGLVAAIARGDHPGIDPQFRMLSGANLSALAMDAGLLMIVAVAQMLVIITRSIDLSVAAVIGLAAYGAASTLHVHPEIGVVGGVAARLRHRLAAGLVNGFVVTYGRVPAIVVTLGTMSIFRGINSLWAGGKQVSADQVPQAWLDMTSASIFGVPAVYPDRRRHPVCRRLFSPAARRSAGSFTRSAPIRTARA